MCPYLHLGNGVCLQFLPSDSSFLHISTKTVSPPLTSSGSIFLCRLSGAVIKGYEQDVGTRTSFYGFTAFSLVQSILILGSRGFQHVPLGKVRSKEWAWPYSPLTGETNDCQQAWPHSPGRPMSSNGRGHTAPRQPCLGMEPASSQALFTRGQEQ